MARRKTTKTSKAIAAINRRADTIRKLYGANSEEYAEFTARMSRYDLTFSDKTGAVHIRDTAGNRANYRQLNAWARQIKKTPYAVEKRKADKKAAQYRAAVDDYEDETGGDRFLDRSTWEKWLSTFNDYFASCYELATMSGASGADAFEYADHLYNSPDDYAQEWNAFYLAGAFDEFRDAAETYQNDAFYQQYGIDPETGEPIVNPDFMDD